MWQLRVLQLALASTLLAVPSSVVFEVQDRHSWQGLTKPKPTEEAEAEESALQDSYALDGWKLEQWQPVVWRAVDCGTVERVEEKRGCRGDHGCRRHQDVLQQEVAVPAVAHRRRQVEGRDLENGAECKEGCSRLATQSAPGRRRGGHQSETSHRSTGGGQARVAPTASASEDSGTRAAKVEGDAGAVEDTAEGSNGRPHQCPCFPQGCLPEACEHDEGDGAEEEGLRDQAKESCSKGIQNRELSKQQLCCWWPEGSQRRRGYTCTSATVSQRPHQAERRTLRRRRDRESEEEGSHCTEHPFGRRPADARGRVTKALLGVPPLPTQAEFRGPMRLFDRVDNLKVKDCTRNAYESLHHAGCRQTEIDPVAVHVYTDGSSAETAGWAMVVLFDDCARRVIEGDKDRVHDRLHGYTGGHLGEGHDNYNAEVYALLYACRWIKLFARTRRDVGNGESDITFYIHSDCTPALSVLEGRSAMVNVNRPAAMLSYEYNMKTENIHPMWVKGHNGMPWNEMADKVANDARESPMNYPDHTKHIQHLESDTHISRRYVLERGRMGDQQYPELGVLPKKVEKPNEGLDGEELARPYIWAVQELRPGGGDGEQNDVTFMTLNALTLLRKGRAQIINKQMKKAGVHVGGLQETRIRKAGRGECDDYHYINGARSEDSANHGCSLWISKKIGKAKVERHHIKVIAQKPRYVAVAVRCTALHAMLVSAHAPHAGHTKAEVEEFWEELKGLIVRTNTAALPVVVMADMNCQPCPTEGRVGSLTEGEKKVEAEHPAVRFMEDVDLCIPHTYIDYNIQGELETTCFSGGESKIDYIMVPAGWLSSTKSSAVLDDVDPTLGKLDHCPVSTTMVRPTTKPKAIKGRHQLPYDIAQVKDKKNADKVKAIMDDAPKPEWHVDQNAHLHMINQHMVARLTEEFPKSKKKQRPDWMAADTIKLIEEKHGCYKQLRKLRKTTDRQDDERDELGKQLKELCKKVAKAVGKDKERQIDEVAQACDAQFSMNDTHNAYKTLKRLRPYQAKPLEIQTTDEGLPVLDQEQAEDEWGKRWKKLLDGEGASFQELFEDAKKPDDNESKANEEFSEAKNGSLETRPIF
eukprot:TRINITY_DN15801_c0_g2_i5.p1 TRINITY_DN15801_c0_g2~~TRINITY_DN15801_c0_g2_i5.p1  ORF type:complete len:1096 (-),score=192.67 TRINITY_DN15801_c0_g2_i5:2335-5622(-)